MNHIAILKKTSAILSLCVVASGCATRGFHVDSATNPPPEKPFVAYSSFELKPLNTGPNYDGDQQKAVTKMSQNCESMLGPVVDSWNQNSNSNGSSIVIQPTVEKVKFVSIGKRIMVGAMAGSSAVITSLTATDKSTGRVVSKADFLETASGFESGFAYGKADNIMLDEVIRAMAKFMQNNYTQAVGGPTTDRTDLVK